MVVVMEDHGQYRVVGQTVDDAAGEAFDKVARFLGLGYPGGPAIDRLATTGDPAAVRVPARDARRARLLVRRAEDRGREPRAPARPTRRVADVAASFQEAVVDQLVDKLFAVADDAGAPTLVIGGGVAANSRLRARVAEAAEATGRRVVPAAA